MVAENAPSEVMVFAHRKERGAEEAPTELMGKLRVRRHAWGTGEEFWQHP
jgi:hypothetical protein